MKIEELINYLENNDASKVVEDFSYDKRLSLYEDLVFYGNYGYKKYVKCLLTIDELKSLAKEVYDNENDNFISLVDYSLPFLEENIRDEIYKDYLESNPDDMDVVGYIISLINDDKLKEKYLLKYNEELDVELYDQVSYKVSIIGSFKDKEYISKYFNLCNDFEKERIIKTSKDIYTSRELFYKLDESGKKAAFKYFFEFNLSQKYKININELSIIQMDIFMELLNIIDKEELNEFCSYEKFKLPKYSSFLDSYIASISKKYSVNYEHLKKMVELTSFDFIKVIFNSNINDILSLNEEDFNKLLTIFNKKNTTLDSSSLNNILYAYAIKIFQNTSENVISSFTTVRNYIDKKRIEEANELIKLICKKQENILSANGYTLESLIEALDKKDKSAFDFFNKLCGKYIDKKRRSFVEEYINEYRVQNLDRVYEVNSAIEYIISKMDFNELYSYVYSIKELTDKEKEIVLNKELFKKLHDFKISKTDISDDIKKNLFFFNSIMNKFYANYKSNGYIRLLLSSSGVKTTRAIPGPDSDYIISILNNLDVKKLKENVFSKDETMENLLGLLNSYKFLAFNKKLKNCEIESEVYCDGLVASSIILNSESILKDLNNQNVSMMSILEVADLKSKLYKVYEILLGKDNFKYLNLNPPENRAYSPRARRRSVAIKDLVNIINRKYVTVPTFDETIELKNHKKINIVCGNFSNPINLTYGERTGSCMRIGGQGEDLYQFCLYDVNAFHIRLSDPYTDEFISRVSGFRNGNTVFLNQLRNPVLDYYNDFDLIEACKAAADYIIEKSKDMPHPIDNVVISKDKVMGHLKEKAIDLKVEDICKGFQYFWFDLDPEEAICLSSSNKDNSLVPIKLGTKKFDIYKAQRDKVRYISNSKDVISRFECLEQLLNNKDIGDMTVSDKEYKDVYYGEDWYLSFDGVNIEAKIMDFSKDKAAAINEMNEVLNRLNKMDLGIVNIDNESLKR